MYEVVKVVKGYEIKRMKDTKGYYEVVLKQGENWKQIKSFKTIKAAAEYIEKNL